MKANELRIGNYLRCNDVQMADYFIVESVPEQSDEFYRWVEPIPLTEGWLVKFGFEKDGIRYSIDDDGVFIWSGLGDFESYGFFVKIKYVHQLQNLYFALTNEELTTELG